VLVLAAGLGLAACSKDDKTALLVDVRLDSLVAPPPDKITFVVSRGSTTFATQHANWSAATAGTLEVGLVLPDEAAGTVTLDVQALRGGNPIAAASPLPSTTIVAGKTNGPIDVLLMPVGGVGGDGGADASPGDGPGPDISGGSETGSPDAGVTPDTRIDAPVDVAAPDAPLLSDALPPLDVAQVPDALPSLDVPQLTDAAQLPDAPQSTDASEAGADTSPDSIAGPAWQPVENVQNDPFGYVNYTAVAVDPVNEHVYVMWIDWSAAAVQVRRWNHTTATWEKTQTLESNMKGAPRNPQIGVDGAGKVTAAWHHYEPQDTTLLGVRVSQSTDGVSWSTPAPIAPSRQVWEISLAVARDGTARLAFTEYGPENDNTPLLYSAYYDGRTWTAGPDPLAPQPVSSSPHFPSPKVVINDQGSGAILFTQMDETLNDSVAVATFAGTTVDPFIFLDSNTTNNLVYRAAAVNRNGQVVVVWADSNGALLRSYSPSTRTWTAEENIGKVGLRDPSVVLASDGTITVAWSQAKSDFYNVWALEGTAGGTWPSPTVLETDNLAIDLSYWDDDFGPLPFPALAIDAADDVLLIWSKKTKNTAPREFAVYGQRKLAGKPAGLWQPATELARKSLLLPWYTSLAVSDKGLGAACFYWGNPNGIDDPDAHQAMAVLFR